MDAQTLTAMTPQVRRAGRVSLQLDGEHWCGASLEAVAELGLRVGMRIDADQRAALERALEGRRAFEAALRMLAARGRTACELTQRLQRKGFEADQAEAAIERCAGLGLIDDAAVLRGRAESLRARGAGERRGRIELERLGAERELLEQVLHEVWPPERRGELAGAALARHARPERLTTAAERQRALGWLLRQGHGADDARRAIAELGPGAEQESADERSRPRPSIDEHELTSQLRRRFPGAEKDPRTRQRAWGWAARRGADHDAFRRALAAAAEPEG